jgi:hypothetical protein
MLKKALITIVFIGIVVIVALIGSFATSEDRATCLNYCSQMESDCQSYCTQDDPQKAADCRRGCSEKASDCRAGCPKSGGRDPF